MIKIFCWKKPSTLGIKHEPRPVELCPKKECFSYAWRCIPLGRIGPRLRDFPLCFPRAATDRQYAIARPEKRTALLVGEGFSLEKKTKEQEANYQRKSYGFVQAEIASVASISRAGSCDKGDKWVHSSPGIQRK